MATEAICYRDAYVREVSGLVARTEPAEEGHGLVVLDRTMFYPGGGGQPSDRGSLTAADGTSWEVRGAHRDGSDIVHEVVAGPRGRTCPPWAASVVASLDWTRRHLLMRTHTALHALCGVVWRDHGALVTGGNMETGLGSHGLRVRVAARLSWPRASRPP